MFVFFAEPIPIARTSLLHCITNGFDQAVGHTRFGDLFLRNKETGEYAIFLTVTAELEQTGETDESGFREQILGNPEVVRTVLRPREIEKLTDRLGALGEMEVFFPVPFPALGGSGELATYEKGGLWEYASLMDQTR